MSYTLLDHHLDSDHNRSLCEECADYAVDRAIRETNAAWRRAVNGNWTCLGCGAEFGVADRLQFSEGCDRCRPLIALMQGPK
jgi:Pyruvate/2-oxoacid:ferredoxin oxidoreductase delta subunit